MGRIRFQWCINPDPFRKGESVVALMAPRTRRPVRSTRDGARLPATGALHDSYPGAEPVKQDGHDVVKDQPVRSPVGELFPDSFHERYWQRGHGILWRFGR